MTSDGRSHRAPVISVVMATYNGERYVDEQLRSILAQRRPPDEIVVMDDGSGDATVTRVRQRLEGGAPASIVRINADRLGPAANFGSGIAAASGDIVVLADQDDRWHLDKLARVEEAFGASSVLAVFSDGGLMDGDGAALPGTLWQTAGFTRARRREWDRVGAFRSLVRQNFVTGAALAFRVALRDAILPIPATAWHDHWIALLAAAQGGIAALPDQLLDYRLHGANTMGLPARDWRTRVRDRYRSADVRGPELARFRKLRERLSALAVAPTLIELVDAKIRHLEFRSALPSSALRRTPMVLGRAVVGEYHQLASGWRSVAIDLARGSDGARPGVTVRG